VAVTPGVDFEEEGSGVGERRVRLSFPGTTEHLRLSGGGDGDAHTGHTGMQAQY